MLTNQRTDIYNYDFLPSKMKALPQWGAWIFVEEKDKHGNNLLDENGTPKKTKLPINATTGEPASSTDPSTWTTFEVAVAYVTAHRDCGLAFFTKAPDDEAGFWIYGVDLDDATDPDTGEFVNWPGAPIQPQEIAEKLNSSSQFTPSCAGVRIFVISRTQLPPRCSKTFGTRNPKTGKRPGLEIYGEGRFFTVTHAALDEYSLDLEDRTEQLLEIHRIVFGTGTVSATAEPSPTRPMIREAVDGLKSEDDEFATAIATNRTATGTRHDILFGVGGWLVGAGWPRERIVTVLGRVVDEFQKQDPRLNAEGKLERAIKHLDETISRYRAGKQIPGPFHLKEHVAPAVVEEFQYREAFTPAIPRNYKLRDDGLYFYPPKQRDNDQTPSPVWLCGSLEVRARTRSVDGDDWGLFLVWADPEGREHTWTMACELLATDGSPVLQELRRCGLNMSYTKNLREMILTYLAGCKPSLIITSVARTGWNGDSYVLPDECIGGTESNGAVVQSNGIHHFKIKGTVEDWIVNVGSLCRNNSRLVFATSVSFAAPLLNVVDMEGGGVHAVGSTSSGKTTMLCGPASVHGRREFIRSWRATSNGLEGIAALHNDCVLILDEIGQADANDVGEAVYMLANGIGKARMNRSGTTRMPMQWRLNFLSAGEKRLCEHMGGVGKKVKGGQEVRLLEFASDAGAGLGVFEDLHGSTSGGEFADRFKRNAAEYYGAVGRAYLNHLVAHRPAVKQEILGQISDFAAKHMPSGAASEVYRGLQRFALIGAAGELATRIGLTGWGEGESLRAAATCFQSWLRLRGTNGGSDIESGIRQVRLFIERHGSTRFQNLDLEGVTFVNNRAGCKDAWRDTRVKDQEPDESAKRDAPYQYYIFSETFKQEVCAGFDSAAVARALFERGYLAEGDKGRYSYKKTIPGVGRPRVYHILPSLFEEEDNGKANDAGCSASAAIQASEG